MRWLTVAFAFFLLFGCGDSVDREQERAAVRDVWSRANRALETGNWEQYSEQWAHTDYVQVIHPGAPEWLSGWAEVDSSYRKAMTESPAPTIRTRDIRVRVSPSGEMAWATMRWDVSVGDGEGTTYWGTGVFEKIDGEWKLVHGMASQPAESE